MMSSANRLVFLGVMPEQTTLGELKNIVFRFGLPLYDYQGTVYSIGYDSDQDTTPDTQFFIQSGMVNSIEISIDPKMSLNGHYILLQVYSNDLVFPPLLHLVCKLFMNLLRPRGRLGI